MLATEMGLSDAALRLKISWHRAWRMGLVGKLEMRKRPDGRSWVVTTESVERLARDMATEPQPAA